MTKNITIIGSIDPQIKVNNYLFFTDVMDQIIVSTLDENILDEYFKCLNEQIDPMNNNNPEANSYNDLAKFLQNYIKNIYAEKSMKFNEDHLNYSINKLGKNNFLRQFLTTKQTKNLITDGVNWIDVKPHICNESTALILPYVIDNIKHLEKPILMCSSAFITSCEGEIKAYKISNEYHQYIKDTCEKLGVLFLEYTGNGTLNYIL